MIKGGKGKGKNKTSKRGKKKKKMKKGGKGRKKIKKTTTNKREKEKTMKKREKQKKNLKKITRFAADVTEYLPCCFFLLLSACLPLPVTTCLGGLSSLSFLRRLLSPSLSLLLPPPPPSLLPPPPPPLLLLLLLSSEVSVAALRFSMWRRSVVSMLFFLPE